MCGRELNREDQRHAAEQIQGFAAEAASVSLGLGDVEGALQRVEFGRGLILGNLIDRRDDLAALREKRADLAAVYEHLRDSALRTIEADTEEGQDWGPLAEGRVEARSQLRACEDEIRRVPGLENFQKPPSAAELRRSAADGPVIIVNFTEIRADAIIVTKDALVSISLSDMLKTWPRKSKARRAGTGQVAARAGRPVESDFKLPNKVKPLTWLWKSCVAPVLRKLQDLGALPSDLGPDDAPPPRVWWIGTGMASSLPFHAADDFEKLLGLQEPDEQQAFWESRSTCLDCVTPSYTPTIKALQYARRRAHTAALGARPTIAVVTMPSTPGLEDLKGVQEEKTAIQGAAAPGFRIDVSLQGPSAEQVLRHLPTSPVMHFACHGTADRADPDASHVLLRRRNAAGEWVADPLTVRMILDSTTQDGQHATGNWLVYLSACSTAQNQARDMNDEGLHLAGAFQAAGFAHAVGALWRADDETCVEMARAFYEALCTAGTGTGVVPRFGVVHAWRKAVLDIRAKHYEDPNLWAPFVHFGA